MIFREWLVPHSVPSLVSSPRLLSPILVARNRSVVHGCTRQAMSLKTASLHLLLPAWSESLQATHALLVCSAAALFYTVSR